MSFTGFTPQEREVYNQLRKVGPCTSRALADSLGWPSRKVPPRVNALMRRSWIVIESGGWQRVAGVIGPMVIRAIDINERIKIMGKKAAGKP